MKALRFCRSDIAVCGAIAWAAGSLVLGQNQECYGACFSPEQALDGDIAALRIWSRVLSQVRMSDQGGVPSNASTIFRSTGAGLSACQPF